MLELIIAMCAVVIVLAMRHSAPADKNTTVARQYFFGFLGLFFLLILVGTAVAYFQTYTGQFSNTYHATIATNTLYQNTNSSVLYLYVTTAGTSTAFIGSNQLSLTSIGNVYATGSSVSYNAMQTVVIPPNWYYKFNYTGTTSFIGEYTNQT